MSHSRKIDRHLAPVLALCIVGIIGLAFLCFWIAYVFRGPEPI